VNARERQSARRNESVYYSAGLASVRLRDADLRKRTAAKQAFASSPQKSRHLGSRAEWRKKCEYIVRRYSIGLLNTRMFSNER